MTERREWTSDDGRVRLICGDCMDVLTSLSGLSACVTDPPYGLSFMGKKWDYDVPGEAVWRLVLACLLPGAHLLSFAGTRTQHRMAVRIEDAGFEIRDCLMYIFGSGFPKSKNIGCKCRGGAVQYSHETESQDLQSVRREVDPENSLSGRAQPDVLASVRGNAHIEKPHGKNAAARVAQGPDDNLPGMREANVEAGRVVEAHEDVFLQRVVPGQEGERSDSDCAPVRPDRHEVSGDRDGRSKQPGMEGRCDVLAEARELQADQVRPVPDGVHADGAEGRLHHGAPPDNGADGRAVFGADGSGASSEPRSARQQTGKSGAIPEQPSAQTSRGRACQKCGGVIGFEGFGSALKPAYEPVWMCRKPIAERNIIENVLRYGTGGINVDGCRVGTDDALSLHGRKPTENGWDTRWSAAQEPGQTAGQALGRWPANLIHDGSDECLALLRDAARFFYCAKASKRDRDEGCEGLAWKPYKMNRPPDSDPEQVPLVNRNHHPTVKPTALMRYLCKLVTPPEGIVLDPFMGSGSTGKAARLEGVRFIGIERDPEYIDIAVARATAR